MHMHGSTTHLDRLHKTFALTFYKYKRSLSSLTILTIDSWFRPSVNIIERFCIAIHCMQEKKGVFMNPAKDTLSFKMCSYSGARRHTRNATSMHL